MNYFVEAKFSFNIYTNVQSTWASQVSTRVKNLPANSGVIRDEGSIPGLGRSLGGRHGNPLQYSRLENTVDRGAWQAAMHSTAESRTRLK